MSFRRIFVLSLSAVSTVAAFSSAALADTVDFNVRDSSVQIQYSGSMGTSTLGKSQAHIGFLYVDKDNMLGDLGFLVKDEVSASVPGLTAGVGLKALAATVKNQDAVAVAMGGVVRYSPPDLTRLGILGQVYVSPNIVTFGDADRFLETGVRVEYEVIPQAVAYLGYRKVRFGLENGPDATLDEGLHLGVRMSF